jgi:hypothetical protein
MVASKLKIVVSHCLSELLFFLRCLVTKEFRGAREMAGRDSLQSSVVAFIGRSAAATVTILPTVGGFGKTAKGLQY